MLFGVELVPMEDRVEGQKLVIDLRAHRRVHLEGALVQRADRRHRQAALHRELHGSSAAWSPSCSAPPSTWPCRAQASYAWESPHLLTGEPLGTDGSPNQNPNYDWRWDAPGRRFRITSAGVFSLQVNGILNF